MQTMISWEFTYCPSNSGGNRFAFLPGPDLELSNISGLNRDEC